MLHREHPVCAVHPVQLDRTPKSAHTAAWSSSRGRSYGGSAGGSQAMLCKERQSLRVEEVEVDGWCRAFTQGTERSQHWFILSYVQELL